MIFASGTRIGPYEVVAALGAGGMGEVLRARDTRLGRDVAIKVLPAAFAQDAERVARFRREAQILASLNHPNIAAIYGLEESEGVLALVMELVEGEDLAERLTRGAIPADDALAIARQIGEALAEAHDKGIVHRDLKPANVKITADGKVKVLDFGLAKAFAEDPTSSASVDLSQSPTLATAAGTRAGIILGTAAYMSPEQARGKAVDKRADIWAFGVVLYEMLTGQRLFAGETVSDVLAAVLTREPDLSAVPRRWHGLLRKCLERDPRQRLRDVGDGWLLLDEGATPSSAAGVNPRGAWPWVAAGVIGGATVMGVLWATSRPPERPQPLRRVSVEVGAEASVSPLDNGPALALSPDGTMLAFTARHSTDDKQRLFVRRLDQLQALELPGTEGARSPFFSPDGQWIAFFADNRLAKVSAGGGPVVTLCPVKGHRGGTWTEDGQIVFAADIRVGLSRVGPAGGAAAPFTTLDATVGEITHRMPQGLPGGRGLLYTAHTVLDNFSAATVWVQPPGGQPRKKVLEGGYAARYVASGHLLFLRDGTLFTVPFDLDRLETTGPPVPAVEHVQADESSAAAHFDVARDGTLAHLSGSSAFDETRLAWLDAQGVTTPMDLKPGRYEWLRVSPEGSRIALGVHEGQGRDVWVYEWRRGTMSRLTFDEADDSNPTWTPDGQRIAFFSNRGTGLWRIFWKRADGTGEEQALTDGSGQVPLSWHPSGKFLAFTEFSPTGQGDIRILPMEGDEASGWKPGTPTTFLASPFAEYHAEFSPDGRWLTYASIESGQSQVYVRPFPGPGGKWQISVEGGADPIWSVDGRQILFRRQGQVMAAAVRAEGDSFSAETPRLWSPGFVSRRGARVFAAVRGESRLAVLSPGESATVRLDKVVLTSGFFDELRRLTAPAATAGGGQ